MNKRIRKKVGEVVCYSCGARFRRRVSYINQRHNCGLYQEGCEITHERHNGKHYLVCGYESNRDGQVLEFAKEPHQMYLTERAICNHCVDKLVSSGTVVLVEDDYMWNGTPWAPRSHP